jgi:hypothetical protein
MWALTYAGATIDLLDTTTILAAARYDRRVALYSSLKSFAATTAGPARRVY